MTPSTFLSSKQSKCVNLGKTLQLAGVCFALLLCLPAHSQTLGRISGIVTDTTGGAVAGATVTVTDVGRGIPRNVTTDNTGTYAAPNLIPGNYSVHAVFMGFKAFDRQGVEVGVGGDVHVDVTLQPGEQTQTVTVTGEVPNITTTNAQLSGTINGDALSDLPMAGHNYLQLLGLLPTIQVRPGSGAGPAQSASNGLKGEWTVYVLDGVRDQENYLTTVAINTAYSAGGPEQAVLLPTDAIQEFNVVENAKAEFGWKPGAQINVAVKSGTNSIHGTAFAVGNDTVLTDRNAFFNIKPPRSFEDFSATFGGPIKKDKLFYLVGYEGQRYSVGNPRLSNVPTTASAPAGIFSPSSSLPDAITDLQNHVAAGGAPPNPVMLALAGCVLGPPVSCTAGKGLFSNAQTGPTVNAAVNLPVDFLTFGGTDNGVGKLDYHLNDNHNLAAEFFDGDGFAVGPVASVNQSYWSTPFEVHTRVARAWWTWVPNSTWVNDLRFGWDNILISNTGSYDCPTQPPPSNGVTDNQWVPGANAPNYSSFGFVGGGLPSCALPTFTVNGFTGSVLGGASSTFDTSGVERLTDTVSWTHGNHITKFGGEIVDVHGTIALQTTKGTLAFNTNVPALNAYPGNTSALDNFMAGIVTTASNFVGTVQRSDTYHEFAGFIQDDWRLSPRITVNLGLRYEYTGTLHEKNNLFGNIALGSPTGIIQQGQGSPLYKLDPLALGPRFGLAWDVSGKGTTVVRVGGNISYEAPNAQTFLGSSSKLQLVPTAFNLSNGTTTVSDGGTINLASVSVNPPKAAATIVAGQSFFGNLANSVAFVGSCSPASPCAIGGVTTHLTHPVLFAWNFGVQHALTNNLTVDANYVGNHGQHEFEFYDINQPTLGASGTANENARRPFTLNGKYPWFSQMILLGAFGGRSDYDALQLTVRKRASHGLTFVGSYTYSHALGMSSTNNGTQPQNSLAPTADTGNLSSDVRHRITFGPSYIIPGPSGYWQMLQGWQITSTASVFSGRPINPIDASDDLSGTGEGQDRWTLAGDPHDFNGFGGFGGATIPCFDNPATASATWKNACKAGLPQACINAANAEPNGPAGVANNTGIASLNRLGCYMMSSSVIVPPAQGTFGSMSLYEIYGVGYWDWDVSLIKTWKIKERLTTQFRAEFYNVTNTTQFNTPASTLSSPSTFGASQATPDIGQNSPIVGTGGPRKIQLGLKFMF